MFFWNIQERSHERQVQDAAASTGTDRALTSALELVKRSGRNEPGQKGLIAEVVITDTTDIEADTNHQTSEQGYNHDPHIIV